MSRLTDYIAPAAPEKVSIEDMLSARDRRRALQERLRQQYALPLVSFTMNMPGEYKRSPASDLLFFHGVELLRKSAGVPLHYELTQEKTGLEVLCVYNAGAAALKQRCREIEESFPAARLFDMDVIGPEGDKLSSPEPRRCVVCGKPVFECSRSRAHGLPAILAAVDGLLEDWLPERISGLAVEALKAEALLAPKPGLVDRLNSGAHGDMDLSLMLKSAGSLKDYFLACARAGLAYGKKEDPDFTAFMSELKALGMKAEETMLSVTGGVNTHRGAVYLMGLLSAALAFRAKKQNAGDAFAVAARLAASGENLLPGSHGEAARRVCPRSGPRNEAVSGFPFVQKGTAILGQAQQRGFTSEQAQLEALLNLMILCEDSNIIYRGGPEGLAFTRSLARGVLALPPEERYPVLEKADREMTAKHLSPGGSADLLSASIFMDSAKSLI